MATPIKIATTAIVAVVVFVLADKGICAVMKATDTAIRAEMFWRFNMGVVLISAVLAIVLGLLTWRVMSGRSGGG